MYLALASPPIETCSPSTGVIEVLFILLFINIEFSPSISIIGETFGSSEDNVALTVKVLTPSTILVCPKNRSTFVDNGTN